MSGSEVTESAGRSDQLVDRHRPTLVLVAVCLGQFMLQLDTTIVNVALPSLGADLHATVSELQWVVDAYILALASLLLIGGRIGDRSGHRRVYLTGLTVFAIGSGLCALAQSPGLLIGTRVLQGVGAAIELPATLAILTHTFTEPRARGQAVGIWAGAGGASLVIGPVLGGALIKAFSWQAVFLVNLPIALVAIALTLAAVKDTAPPSASALDIPGQALGTLALAALAGGVIEGGREGFGSPLALALLAGGAGALIAFVALERTRRDPVLDLRFFRRAAYSAANGDGLVMGFVMFGVLFLFALFFQQVQGASAIAAGVRFLPLTVAFLLTGPIVGRMIDRVGHRLPMTVGCALMGAGMLSLLGVAAHSGYGAVWWPFVLVGVGYGLTSTPMAAAVLGAVPAERAGMASSTNNTARQVGGVFGIAILGSLLPHAAAGSGTAFASGLHTGLVIAAIVAFLGAGAAALFIREPSGDGGQPDSSSTT
jgi:EmrB/QacA subfamily drug resistance transporter